MLLLTCRFFLESRSVVVLLKFLIFIQVKGPSNRALDLLDVRGLLTVSPFASLTKRTPKRLKGGMGDLLVSHCKEESKDDESVVLRSRAARIRAAFVSPASTYVHIAVFAPPIFSYIFCCRILFEKILISLLPLANYLAPSFLGLPQSEKGNKQNHLNMKEVP